MLRHTFSDVTHSLYLLPLLFSITALLLTGADVGDSGSGSSFGSASGKPVQALDFFSRKVRRPLLLLLLLFCSFAVPTVVVVFHVVFVRHFFPFLQVF